MRTFTCSGRAVAAGLVLLVISCFVISAFAGDSSAGWLLRLVGSSLFVVLAPGVLVLLAWRPRRRLSVLEVISIGFGVSFALVQLLTLVAMLLHRSPAEMLAILGVIGAIHGGVVVLRRRHMTVSFSSAELWLLASMLVIAAGAYLQGSPFDDVEDYIHIAIIRRLAALTHPSLDNIYFIPHLIYTYPFPGTHYAMALIARIGALDPLFLYYKLRAVWVVASLAAVYAFTRQLFRSRRVALTTSFAAVALLANGTFGTVKGLFWGGLAPFSHTSEIAMGVLLPSLLVVLTHYLRSTRPRGKWFFAVVSVALVVMLMIVHTREIVQLIVYLAASVVALALIRAPAGILRRAVLMLGLTIVIAGAYLVWHRATVPIVVDLVASNRPDLSGMLRRHGWNMLMGDPSRVLADYIRSFELLFAGWTPIVLLAGPLILYPYRRRPLTIVMSASILAYLLIIRIPMLGAAYVWGTYFEILFTPVRNVIFFVYVLTGVGIYSAARRLAQWPTAKAIGAALLVVFAAVMAYRFADPVFARSPTLTLTAAVIEYSLFAWLVWWQRNRSIHPGRPEPQRRSTPLVAASMVVPLALSTILPSGSPLWAPVRKSINTPAALIETFRCEEVGGVTLPFVPADAHVSAPMLPTVKRCPPSADLLEFVTHRIPEDAVFAIDKFVGFPLPLLAPRQIVSWPGTNHVFRNEEEGMFRDYFKLYRASVVDYGVQPFFNDRGSHADRVRFVQGLGVTHVLVDPIDYDMMTRVLGSETDVFRRVFEKSHWTVYEVLQ